MATLTATLTATDEGLLCHCDHDGDVDEAGHAIEACGVKLGPRAAVGWPRLRSYVCDGGRKGGLTRAAAGTCPVCGALVRVDRRNLYTSDRPDVHDLIPGVRVGFVVELRAHRHARQPCPGGGQRPTETRYRFPGVEAAVRDYGPEVFR